MAARCTARVNHVMEIEDVHNLLLGPNMTSLGLNMTSPTHIPT